MTELYYWIAFAVFLTIAARLMYCYLEFKWPFERKE